MKYCQHCGKELLDAAMICPSCGCETVVMTTIDKETLVKKLSSKLKTCSILWCAAGIGQLLMYSAYSDTSLILVALINLGEALNAFLDSKSVLKSSTGIVKRAKKLWDPITTLILNLALGGILGIGAIGSIYYFAAARSFVMENKEHFLKLEELETTSAQDKANT